MTRRRSELRAPAAERMAGRQWKAFTPFQRNVIVAGAVVQVALLTAAQIDITRRPPDQIRGTKALWRLIVLINFLGPVAYFSWGRNRRPTGTAEPGPQAVA